MGSPRRVASPERGRSRSPRHVGVLDMKLLSALHMVGHEAHHHWYHRKGGHEADHRWAYHRTIGHQAHHRSDRVDYHINRAQSCPGSPMVLVPMRLITTWENLAHSQASKMEGRWRGGRRAPITLFKGFEKDFKQLRQEECV